MTAAAGFFEGAACGKRKAEFDFISKSYGMLTVSRFDSGRLQLHGMLGCRTEAVKPQNLGALQCCRRIPAALGIKAVRVGLASILEMTR